MKTESTRFISFFRANMLREMAQDRLVAVSDIVFDNFSRGLYGVATALSTLFFVVMVILSYFVIRVMQPREVA